MVRELEEVFASFWQFQSKNAADLVEADKSVSERSEPAHPAYLEGDLGTA